MKLPSCLLLLPVFFGFHDTSSYAASAAVVSSESFTTEYHAYHHQEEDRRAFATTDVIQKRELNNEFSAIWNYVPRTKTTDIVSQNICTRVS